MPDKSLIVAWLARVLGDNVTAEPLALPASADEILAEARHQGVLALMAWRLQTLLLDEQAKRVVPGTALSELTAAFATASREPALASMVMEAEVRNLLGELDRLHMPALLLKGTALAHWLFPAPHSRHCSDIDLLVPDQDDARRLAKSLHALGYDRALTSGEPVAYEVTCSKSLGAHWAIEADIHWRLLNSPLFAEVFSFDELMLDARPLPKLGHNAMGLGNVHAVLHACMHRALNLSTGWEDKLKWLYDLHALAKRLDHGEWLQIVETAATKKIAGVVLNGLEKTALVFGTDIPEQTRDRLGRFSASEAMDASRLSDWRYMQRQTMRSLPGPGLKLRWLWQRLFPSHDRLVLLYGQDVSYPTLLMLRARRMLGRLLR